MGVTANYSYSRMRIALVSPPYGLQGESMHPLGLIALKVYLDEKFGKDVETLIFDFSDSSNDSYTLLEDYEIPAFDLVGLCSYSTNFPIVLSWALRIKTLRSNCRTVIGGPHTTSLSEHIAGLHAEAFDYVVRGEGELVLATLVKSLLNGITQPLIPGLTYQTKLGPVSTAYMDIPEDINALPPPVAPVIGPNSKAITYYDKRDKRLRNAIALTSSRGCPFRCSFCSISSTETKWRAASAETIATWINQSQIYAHKPIEHVYFMDADFMIRKDRVLEIGEMFARHYPKMTWSFSGRVDDIKRIGKEALIKLASQGLRFIESGLESGSQAALDRMDKQVTVQDNLDAIKMLRSAGLEITVDFIFFLPDSTPEHLKENLQFLIQAGLTEIFPNDHYYTYLILYPATPLRKYYEKIFDIKFDIDLLPDPDNLFVHESTRRIFQYFVRDFSSYRAQIVELLKKIEDKITNHHSFLQNEIAQRLRIESISLRHIPFLVLDQLLVMWHEPTLLEAVPWLEEFEAYKSEIENICLLEHSAN